MKRIAFIAAALLGVVAAESRADACGACIQPSETPSVVTDHRMIFSISKDQSTLYDQIRYSGSPSSFGWVLPVVGDVEVGVSSDLVFASLDQRTQTQIFAPPQNCPPLPTACLQNRGKSAGFAADGGLAPSDAVTVLQRKVVGPYDTAILKATDPNALFDWAQKNGFVINDDSKPVIAEYQKENFNFLAVKLVPSAGVQDMRPIRVTTKGANVALPLRMVAVGAGATLGITLWVLSEGRMEPTNFATFAIRADDLAWDWATNKSNFLDVRTAKTAAANGRAWELESSTSSSSYIYGSPLRTALLYGGYDPATGAYPQPLGDGGYTAPNYEADWQKSAEQVRDEDIAALFHGLSEPMRITRLRADLGRAALDQDLTLGASADQNELPTIRQLTKELNEPQCPVYSNCEQVGTAPRSQAAAQTATHANTVTVGGDSDSGCSATQSREGASWMAATLGFLAFSLSRKLRRRGKKS